MADNPFASWFSNPKFKSFASEALQDFGYGLSNSTNFGNAFGSATNRMAQMQPYRDQMAAEAAQTQEKQQAKNATLEWLQSRGYSDLVAGVEGGGLDIATAWGEALRRGQPQAATADWSKLNDGTLYNQRTGEVVPVGADGAGSTEYGLTPIWGQMPDGTFGYGVQGKDGTFRQVDTGDLAPLDPRSLAGERAFGTAIGTSQGQGAAAATGDVANVETAISLLDQIENSPELPWATGTSAGMGANKIPGTGRFGFQNLVDQAKSGAFLSAIQQMRGMGALSNAEGQVATAAITRMDTALSEADFRKALADYRAILQKGLERAQGRIGAQPNVNAPAAAAGGAVLTYNPATGRLE